MDTAVTKHSAAPIDDPIFGLDLMVVAGCGRHIKKPNIHGRSGHWCMCPKRRVAYHSVTSRKLILRCPWCGARHGPLTEDQDKRLRAFVARYGFTARSIVLVENGETYVS
jgi:hypothetical protein